MAQSLETKNELVDELIEETLPNKLRRISKVLRNHEGIFQVQKRVYAGDNMMCATGLLLFRAGVPKPSLNDYQFNEEKALQNYYNLTKKECKMQVDSPVRYMRVGIKLYLQKKLQLQDLIVGLNDKGWSFDQIADYVDSLALKLESSQ
jgi:hypothetical protein